MTPNLEKVRPETTEKTSPLTGQKRCSLPGPMGALNLYATHQQRRLSERGLMIYKPNKPDIDLIRDFTNPSKKTTPSFICDRDPMTCQNQQRRHSTIINVMASSSSSSVHSPSASASTSSAPWLGNYNTQERRHSSIIPGSSSGFPSHFHTSSNFPSSSKSNAKSSTPPGIGNFSSGPIPSIALGNLPGTNISSSSKRNSSSSTALPSTSNSANAGCRKVRLRIQKNPGAKDQLLHFTPLPGRGPVSATTSPLEDEDKLSFLRHPQSDIRRYSDSAATIRQPPHICITPDGVVGRGARGFCKDSGIVCSTGDLLTLKCLTSSAQEIRCGSSSNHCIASAQTAQSPQTLGNRSRSFDATIVMARKGPGSSWFSRRHQPIAVKLPLPINSPTISSPGDTRYFPGNAAGILRTPILTITNENASKSELIEIPSPPAASPASSRNSPEERTKVAWDKNGFVLDAAVLGIAIENHLRKVDMRRRATFSALYQPPPVFLESKVTTRARSASACVIPIPISMLGSHEDDNSSSGSTSKSTSGRKSSLTSSGRVFSWDRASSSISAAPAPATTSVTFTSVGNSSSGHQTYETHLHRLPLNMGMAASVYINSMESPTNDSFVNFRATEDDIEEETLVGEEDDIEEEEEDEEPKESQAFLPRQNVGSSGRGVTVPGRGASSSSSSPAPSRPSNEGNQTSGNNPSRGTGMSICSAIRDFILQSIRS
ncbi:unnamed protein product [Allacma fusca]|uniref:Uncharacterized protein n=1 Tax=Allacma fusca TaxID=39272 RepID=A0A8J2PAE6_9HEXA|nr:unnamed protein product [Allacma fusca]